MSEPSYEELKAEVDRLTKEVDAIKKEFENLKRKGGIVTGKDLQDYLRQCGISPPTIRR